ncbi:uncharacterized protein LOC125035082 [Penaeus chinensis]|uniref:uncharacterized protein LOC125035082 n=1 Tax=Penaeus chinensis TaxID=139456 RepID=UPI001FB7FCA5|nr:uncharacterized protein LOC125035082 [Penaeus chinensis]XP_047483177.1 uncharacterized protein LOC125035082 [Penaeus chinensis]
MHRIAISTTRPWLCSCSCNLQVFDLTMQNTVVRYGTFSRQRLLVSNSYFVINPSWKGIELNRTNVRCMSTSRQPPDSQDPKKDVRSSDANRLRKEDMNNNKFKFEKVFSLIYEKGHQFQSYGDTLKQKMETSKALLTSKIERKEGEKWKDTFNRWYENYQDFVGITDLKKAQDKVTELSETLLETQSKRREFQVEIEKLQENLIINQQRITKTELYSDEHYTLFDEAREMNASLKTLRGEFQICERLERDTFSQLSAAIRDCHERERFQAEQSKYWSIIASLVSAALASIITSINNWVRIREVKEHVSTNSKQLMAGYIQLHSDVISSISEKLNTASTITTDDKSNQTDIPRAQSSTTQSKTVVHQASEKQSSQSAFKNELAHLTNSVGSVKKDIDKLITDVGSLKESMSALIKAEEQTIKSHVASLLSKERKLLSKQINSQLESVFAKVFLTSENNGGETLLIDEESRNSLPLTLDDRGKPEIYVVEYSYYQIFTFMAVGAGIGMSFAAILSKLFSNG